MNEQNPKLEKIMNKVPGGLIISGIMWLIMCILIIAGMYLIKYPHFTYISVIYSKHLIKYTLYFHKIENSISTLVKS